MNTKQFVKVVTGIIIVPLGIAASKLWPWWTRQDLPIQLLSGVAVLPFVGIAALLSGWWGEY